MTLPDRAIVALTLWAEARSEPVEGRIAIACVIKNRLADGRWGHTYESVCLAPKQFSCWNAGADANHLQLLAVVTALEAGTPPTPILAECFWIADGTISGAVRPRVGNATHYHTTAIAPKWAQTGQLVARIGTHLFFAGVA